MPCLPVRPPAEREATPRSTPGRQLRGRGNDGGRSWLHVSSGLEPGAHRTSRQRREPGPVQRRSPSPASPPPEAAKPPDIPPHPYVPPVFRPVLAPPPAAPISPPRGLSIPSPPPAPPPPPPLPSSPGPVPAPTVVLPPGQPSPRTPAFEYARAAVDASLGASPRALSCSPNAAAAGGGCAAELHALRAELNDARRAIAERDARIATLELVPGPSDGPHLEASAQRRVTNSVTAELVAAKQKLREAQLEAERRQLKHSEQDRVGRAELERLRRRAEEAERMLGLVEQQLGGQREKEDRLRKEIAMRDDELQRASTEMEEYVSKDREWEHRLRTALQRDEDQEKRRDEEERDLRTKVNSLSHTTTRLDDELRGALADVSALRSKLKEEEAKSRAAEVELRTVRDECRVQLDQVKRGGRSHEKDVGALREQLRQRDDELTALQMSNREWLRQFRKQKAELARKSLEVDWLRSLDTSDATLEQLGLTREDADAITSGLDTAASLRQRDVVRALGCPPHPLSSGR